MLWTESFFCSWVHKDNAYADFAFSWCVGRWLDDPESQPALHTMTTRKRKVEEVHIDWPAGGGGSYIDTSLKVIVCMAAGTMYGYHPAHHHGTSRRWGAHTRQITIAFSTHIANAHKQALKGNQVVSKEGAGEGNEDAY